MIDTLTTIMEELAPWLLLGAAVSGVLHAILPPRFVASHLSGRGGVFKAVLFGVPLPLCSCGVIPAGLGLKKDGAGDGASLGFLISTPQTGVDSVLVSAGMLGWPFALFKLGSAAFLGVVGGLLGERFGSDQPHLAVQGDQGRPGAVEGFWHAVQVLRSIWGWLVFGVVLSALITLYAPAETIGAFADRYPSFVYLGVLAISVPLYVCATASVPIAASLVVAGLPTGAALVFLVAGPATNVATIGAVGKAFGKRLLAVYLGTLIIGSSLLGWAFDFVLPQAQAQLHSHHEHGSAWWATASALVLALAFLVFAVEAIQRQLKSEGSTMENGWSVRVDGMTCGGCSSRLERLLGKQEGVDSVVVDLEGAQARVVGSLDASALVATIEGAGFEAGTPEPIGRA